MHLQSRLVLRLDSLCFLVMSLFFSKFIALRRYSFTNVVFLEMQKEKHYLVKYKGLAHVHNRWIPESQLLHKDPMLLAKFNKKHQKEQVTSLFYFFYGHFNF